MAMEVNITVNLPGIPEAFHDLAEALREARRGETRTVIAKAAVTEEPKEKKPRKSKKVEPESPLNVEVIEEITPAPAPETAEAPAPETAEAPAPEPEEKEATREYTFADISNAGAALCAKGLEKIGELTALLNTKYKVNAITKLKPEQYAEIAEDLRALGAEI